MRDSVGLVPHCHRPMSPMVFSWLASRYFGQSVIIGILCTFPGTSDGGKSRCNTGWIPYVFLRRSRRKFSGVRLNRDDYTSDGIRKHLSLDVIVIMKIMMTWWWLTVLSAYTSFLTHTSPEIGRRYGANSIMTRFCKSCLGGGVYTLCFLPFLNCNQLTSFLFAI